MASKITVLVAIKDQVNFIHGCLDCLLNQTVGNQIEIIVIDSSSSILVKAIIRKYQKYFPRIKYIYLKKQGLYHAWNVGIKRSEGQYITNLNADDRLKKNSLEIMSQALDNNPDIALVYGDQYVTHKPNENFSKRLSHWSKRPLRSKYSSVELISSCVCGAHPMWRRGVHHKIGYFDESYMIAGDYEFWLRMAEHYNMLHVRRDVGLFYKNPKGLSANLNLMAEESLKIRNKYFQQCQ